MKTIIHVNQHIIKANRKNGTQLPVLTVKTYKSNTYAQEAIIRDKDGEEVARVVYSPDKPLSCGAHVWIETQNTVELVGSQPSKQVLSKKLEHSIKLIRECSRLSEETKQKNIELLKASVNP